MRILTHAQRNELCELITDYLGYQGEDISIHDVPDILQDFGVTREQLVRYLTQMEGALTDLALKAQHEDPDATVSYQQKAQAVRHLIAQVQGGN